MKLFATIAAVLLLLSPVAFGQGEEYVAPPDMEPDPEVVVVEDEEAKKLLDALAVAEKTRELPKIGAAIDAIVLARNEKFVKPLGKLTKHRAEALRVAAVKALGSQVPMKKIGPMIYKVMKSPQNKDSVKVQAAAIASLRRVQFDSPPVMKELESIFKKVQDTDLMRECIRYFGDLKKVEMVPLLIDWVEAPQPANVNSGTNPPAAYWERMWNVWDQIKKPVRDALTALTGKDYPTETQWRVWVKSDEARKLGIR